MTEELMTIEFEVNGKPITVEIPTHWRLLDVLREKLDLIGTKEGCGQGECGTCTVLLDGKPVNSCLVLAGQADGRKVTTIEGIASPQLHPIQQALLEEGGVQCGFCTPGVIITAFALLKLNPHPTEAEIRQALAGNLCRCTGYEKIVSAVAKAADYLAAAKSS